MLTKRSAECIRHPADNILRHLAGQEYRAIARMVIPFIKFTKHFRSDGMIIFLHHYFTTWMLFAIKRLQQAAMCQEINFGSIDQILLDIGIEDSMQFFFRKKWFFNHGFYHLQCFRQILIQRINSDVCILRRAGQFEPRTVVIQFLGNGSSRIFCRTFAQHPVCKQGLQFLRLLPTGSSEKHIHAYYFLFTRINNSQWNTIWQCHSDGRKYTKIFQGLYFRLYFTIHTIRFYSSKTLLPVPNLAGYRFQ